MIDYFKEINRALTGLIAGILSTALLVGSIYLLTNSLGDLKLAFILASVIALYVSLFIGYFLNYYFYKLLDKDNYTKLSKFSWVSAILSLLILILAFPFVFLYGFEILIATVFFIHMLNITIREDQFLIRRVSNLFGAFVILIFAVFIHTNFQEIFGTNPLMQITQVGILIPMLMFTGSIFEFVGQIFTKIVLSDSTSVSAE